MIAACACPSRGGQSARLEIMMYDRDHRTDVLKYVFAHNVTPSPRRRHLIIDPWITRAVCDVLDRIPEDFEFDHLRLLAGNAASVEFYVYKSARYPIPDIALDLYKFTALKDTFPPRQRSIWARLWESITFSFRLRTSILSVEAPKPY